MKIIPTLTLTTLIILMACTTGDVKDIFIGCKQSTETSKDPVTLMQGDLTFQLTKNWLVTPNEDFQGIECADTAASNKDSRLRTFSVYAREKSTDLLNHFDSEIKTMKKDSVEIYRQGTGTISGYESYYVITRDSIDINFIKEISFRGPIPITQAFFYVDYGDKRYILQLRTTSTPDPIEGICNLMWIIDRIKFKD